MSNIVKDNPNASVTVGSTGAGIVVTYVLGLLGVPVPPEVALAAWGAVTAAVLYVGRHGVKGIFGRLWGGAKDEPADEGDEPGTWEG